MSSPPALLSESLDRDCCQNVVMRVDANRAGELVHQNGLWIVGERHGTNEFPELVSLLVTGAASRGAVTVAIELGDDAQDATSSYLHSKGTRADRLRLLSVPSWQRHDGRASLAMLALVEHIRAIANEGALVEIAVFDREPVGDPLSDKYRIERERMVAERLLEIRRQGTVLALTGNVHAESEPRFDAPAGFASAASLIAEEVDSTSILGRHAGGESFCMMLIGGELVSGPHPVEGVDLGSDPFIEVDTAASGVAYVGSITASPPATYGEP